MSITITLLINWHVDNNLEYYR